MKIADKISLLIAFFVLMLCANTFIGLSQLSKIGGILQQVATKDVVLMEHITAITQHQLEKSILFERTIRIAEELGFANLTAQRRLYLKSYTQTIMEGIESLSAKVSLSIRSAQHFLSDAAADSRTRQAEELLRQIIKSHSQYNLLIEEFLQLLEKDAYQVSFEEIHRIEREERQLTKDVKALLDEIQFFIRKAIENARNEEKLTNRILWISFGINLIISIVLALLIIRSIARPLRALEDAAHKVGEGYFAVSLNEAQKDEIGEVSTAFNTMAKKLDFYSAELKRKSEDLARNLQITEEQKKDLEKVNKELDRFVYTVSHDIGAPLMGIAWYSNYLQKHYIEQLDEKGKNCVHGIQRSTERLNLLIKDLLTLTRISRVKNPYEKAALRDLINAVLERLEFSIKENNVKIVLGNGLPDMVCDRIKLGEVYLNLINNAIKFSSKNNKPGPEVEIGYQNQDSAHQMFVRDNGIGIDPKFQKEIFGIFRRLHEAGEYEGSGAGLTIVKEIIEDHGGKIWVESAPGKGATFYFTIPKDLRVGTTKT